MDDNLNRREHKLKTTKYCKWPKLEDVPILKMIHIKKYD